MQLQVIQNKIYELREQKVMFDFDLAELYGVETRALKQAVKRNIDRFPADFMYVLSENDVNQLVS
ncbi:MAG: ORF6N domain-containing protein, partial [Dysgonamonadaceae bacterium]|nr:ORF6N domain-containing protein [Dysgonamonadaceae bacterium]